MLAYQSLCGGGVVGGGHVVVVVVVVVKVNLVIASCPFLFLKQ